MKLSSFTTLGLGLLAFGVLFADAAELKLASQGKSRYTIVLSDDAIPAETTAATELKNHLESMTGATFPIVSAADFTGGPMIAVGFNDRLPAELAAVNYPGLGVEELVIASAPDTLLLAGGRPRGALYAVYEFLDKLGVRWYTPKETLIPSRPELQLDVTPERYTSPFRSRTQVPGNGVTPEWCARNRMNSLNEWNHPGEAYGGGVKQGPDMHTFWRIFNPAEFKQHPEWAAMVDGVRETETGNNHWGVCLSNDALRRRLIESTLAWVRQNPDVTDVWIGQNDGSPYCQCDDCRALYAQYGGEPSAAIVLLINELADAMKSEFPDKRLKTLAYGWSLKPPKNMKLDDRVTVMVCAGIPQCVTLGRDADAQPFLDSLAVWKNVATDLEVYIYSYPTDSSWFPMPCLYSQARNIKYLAGDGIKSIHQELFGVGTGDGGDMVDLRAWLYTQLMWHPDADIEALVEDFCRGYYGVNADAVLAAIRTTHRRVEAGELPPATGNLTFAVPAYVYPDVIREVVADLGCSYENTADPVFKRRVGYALLPYLWADFWLGMDGLGAYDKTTGTWGIPIPDRERRAREGNLIRQLMIENNTGTLRLGMPLNPHSLRLAEMTRSYPAERLTDGRTEVVVVPGCYGKMVEFTSQGFKPLKSAWGAKILDYPHTGCGSDLFFGHESASFQVTERTPEQVTMQASAPFGRIRKQVALKNGLLEYTLQLTANREVKGCLRTAPFLDLNPDAFGLYPTLYLNTPKGWQGHVLGKAGSMWYQAGGFDLTGFGGRMLLVAESGDMGLELQIAPDRLGKLSYMYDRYDFEPKGTGRVLELSMETPERTLATGQTEELAVNMRLLSAGEIKELLNSK